MTFKIGESGNPNGRRKGTPNKCTKFAKFLESSAPELINKVIELALNGDTDALRMCIDRLLPKIKREPTGIEWPTEWNENTIAQLEYNIVQAALDGKISFSEIQELKKLIPGNKSSAPLECPVFSSDPVEAAKTYARFIKGELT